MLASRESTIETFKAGVRHAAWSDAKPKFPPPPPPQMLDYLERENFRQNPQIYDVDRFCQSQETMELNEDSILAPKKWEIQRAGNRKCS